MASIVFDKLWDDAFKREGELVTDATTLARIYKITSAVVALRLARALQAAGQPFFDCCDDLYRAKQRRVLDKLKRRYQLSPHDVQLAKELMDKAMKGW
jgi:hypothetical protein